MVNKYYGDVEKVFLCDGDAIAIDIRNLLEILDCLKQNFPLLRRGLLCRAQHYPG